MLDIVRSLLGALRATVRTHRALALENLALRHQLTVLQRRTQGRTRLTPADRLLWVWLARSWREWRQGLILVRPETVVRWSRQRFRTYWARKSRRRSGRPAIDPDIRALIRKISRANPLWGTPRIDSELRKLGINVSPTTVAKYRVGQRHINPTPRGGLPHGLPQARRVTATRISVRCTQLGQEDSTLMLLTAIPGRQRMASAEGRT